MSAKLRSYTNPKPYVIRKIGSVRVAFTGFIYKDAKIVVMSPSATNPALTQSGDYPNFFRTIASGDNQAKLGVDFALGTLKAKKIVIEATEEFTLKCSLGTMNINPGGVVSMNSPMVKINS